MVITGRLVHLTNNSFFLGKLDQGLNQCFVHILLLVTDNNPSWTSSREENNRRNYFMINLHESMGPSWDQTRDPLICCQTCICSQTHYWLSYAAQYSLGWYCYASVDREVWPLIPVGIYICLLLLELMDIFFFTNSLINLGILTYVTIPA